MPSDPACAVMNYKYQAEGFTSNLYPGSWCRDLASAGTAFVDKDLDGDL